MNLLAETIELLSNKGKAPSDVRWAGAGDGVGTWDDFARLADFEYDAGYGGNEVAAGLVIVGDDWWLERGEYDGSEWWEFKTLPRKSEVATALRADDLKY